MILEIYRYLFWICQNKNRQSSTSPFNWSISHDLRLLLETIQTNYKLFIFITNPNSSELHASIAFIRRHDGISSFQQFSFHDAQSSRFPIARLHKVRQSLKSYNQDKNNKAASAGKQIMDTENRSYFYNSKKQ